MEKIYIKNFKKEEVTTLVSIFDRLTNGAYSPNNSSQTYIINENNEEEIQCGPSRARSLRDIVSICLTYFPESNDIEIFKELYKYITNHNDGLTNNYMVIIFCDSPANNFVLQYDWTVDEYEDVNDEDDELIYIDIDDRPDNETLLWDCAMDYNHNFYGTYYADGYGYNLFEFLVCNGIPPEEIHEYFARFD